MTLRSLPWNVEIQLDGARARSVMLLSGFGSGPETLRDLAQHLHGATGATVLVGGLARHTGDQREFYLSRSWHYLRDAWIRRSVCQKTCTGFRVLLQSLSYC